MFAWLVGEVVQRDPDGSKPQVYLSDGQETLWEARAYWLPQRNSVDILDLLHVTPRLWQAAHVFHPEKSVAAEQFVRHQLLRVLQGKTLGVLRRFLRLGSCPEVDDGQAEDATHGMRLSAEEPAPHGLRRLPGRGLSDRQWSD